VGRGREGTCSKGYGGVSGPVLEEDVPSRGPEGLVGPFHELGGGGMFVPDGRGACRTRGRLVMPSSRGRVMCARASTGRCFLIGGEGTFTHQSRGR